MPHVPGRTNNGDGASARETVGVAAPTVTRPPAPPPHYPICPRPRTCPHPCCGITAFDSGGADACHIGLRGCSCWLYCSRSCSSSTLPSADPASVGKSSHGRQPRARGELHTCPGFLGRPPPLPGSTDCGVSHRRRAPGHFNTAQELELDRQLISGARSCSHWRTDGLSRGERRPGSGSEAPVHLLGRDGRTCPLSCKQAAVVPLGPGGPTALPPKR